MDPIDQMKPAGHRARGFVLAFFPLARASALPEGRVRVHDGSLRWIAAEGKDGTSAWVATEAAVRAALAGGGAIDAGEPAGSRPRRGGPWTDPEVVRAVRDLKARGVPQRQIAARLGLSEATVSRIVRGRRRAGSS